MYFLKADLLTIFVLSYHLILFLDKKVFNVVQDFDLMLLGIELLGEYVDV